VPALSPHATNAPANYSCRDGFLLLPSSSTRVSSMAAPACSFQAALQTARRTTCSTSRGLNASRNLAAANSPYRQLRKTPGYKGRRCFSQTSGWRLQTKELDEVALKSLKVNKKRLMADLHHTCQWGTGRRWGKYAVASLSLPSAS
jgi:hypothetical protein